MHFRFTFLRGYLLRRLRAPTGRLLAALLRLLRAPLLVLLQRCHRAGLLLAKGSQRERPSARKDSSAFGRSTKGFIGLASIESRIKRSRIARGNAADERNAFSSGQLNGFRRLFANFSGRREPSCHICDAINRTVLWLLVDRPIVVVVARST